MDDRVGYSAADVRAAEQPLLARGEPLMRRAAAALAAELRALLAERGAQPGRLLVLVGAGDNGGDALFAAAELAAEGVHADLVLTASRAHSAGLEAARAAGVQLVDAAQAAELTRAADIVVDGILGTGTARNPALRDPARSIVGGIITALAAMEERRPLIVAVDLPSGISPDDGNVPDPHVLRADMTVTFGAVKAGLLRAPGADYAGRIVLVDLGLDLSSATPLVRLDAG